MSKNVKWLLIILGSISAVLCIGVAGLSVYANNSFKKIIDRPVYPISADSSPEGLARGEYIVRSLGGCVDCHSRQADQYLSGYSEEVVLGPVQATVTIPNITPDDQTGLGAWTDAEIGRAIREGLDREGRSLLLMPSFNYHSMSDADVAAVVAYLRTVEPVNNPLPEYQANLVGKVMLALGMFGPNPVGEPITGIVENPAPGTPAYAEYVTTLAGCRDCHGQDYAGGKNPAAAPDDPPAPNLTSGGDFGSWSEADFERAIRNGLTPDGRVLDPTIMPWPVYGTLTDSDLSAIYQYLHSLEPLQNSN
jgi:mono/diheme cytochrome c family protein